MKTWTLSAVALGLVLGLGVSPAQAGDKGKKKSPEASFSKKDKNGDGFLTEQEFAGKKGGAKAATKFAKVDKDKDGKVSLAELKTPIRKKKSKKS